MCAAAALAQKSWVEAENEDLEGGNPVNPKELAQTAAFGKAGVTYYLTLG